MEYIHYGHKEFDINKFQPISNIQMFCKPKGGLWASPINTSNGWKDWCESEQFRDCLVDNSFKFILKPNAKILYWNSVDDLKDIPQTEKFTVLERCYNPDFEKLQAVGYDVIIYNLSNDPELYWALYGWDCDSILVMNPNVVEVV